MRNVNRIWLALMLILFPTMSWAKDIVIGETKASDPGQLYWIGGLKIEQPKFVTNDNWLTITIVDSHGQLFPFFVPEPATPTSTLRKIAAWSKMKEDPAIMTSVAKTTIYTRLIESRDSILTAEGYSASQRADMLVSYLQQFPEDIINPHKVADNVLGWKYSWVSYESTKTLSDDPVSRPSFQESRLRQVNGIVELLRQDCAVIIGWDGLYSARPLVKSVGKNLASVYPDLPEYAATAINSPLTIAQLRQLARR